MANISEINGFGIYAQTASLANATTFASSANSVLVDREVLNGPAYLTYVDSDNPFGDYEILYTNSNVYLTGSTLVSTRVSSSFTGSLLGTASFATTSSYARSAGIQLNQGVDPISFKLTDANNSTISTLSAPTSSLALTASYINPTFISASAAASGFGSGGGSGINISSIFGGGEDGNLTINNSTTTLNRDFFYNTITLQTNGILQPSGWRVFCKSLIFSGSGGRIDNGGSVGATAASGTGAAGGAGGTAGGFLAVGQTGGAGASGATTAAGGQSVAVSLLAVSAHPNVSGPSGKGGNTALRTGGAAGAANTITNIKYTSTIPFVDTLLRVTATVNGGVGGRGGSSGASDSATPGRGGGGVGGGGGGVIVFAESIDVTNGTAPVFASRGGNGGNGGPTVTADTAGGGGGSGGAGGYIIVVYKEIIGSLSGAVDASGGNGGNGGSGGVSGAAITGDNGGGSGGGGRIVLINVSTGAVTHVLGTTGAAGSAATGTAGASGAIAAPVTASL